MAARSDQALRRVCAATIDQLETLIPRSIPGGWASLTPTAAREQIGQVMFLITDILQTLECPTTTRPESLSVHLKHRRMAENTILEVTRGVVGDDTAEVLAPQARRLLEDLRKALAARDLPATVDTLFGTARLVDFLRSTLIEALALAIRGRTTPSRGGITEGTRALTSVLGERFPGAVIELRIPPAAAVQLGAFGEGPAHTRGTPPNVIETDPSTFIALATGLLRWSQAREQRLVDASGAQIDALARMLPVIDLKREARR